MPQSSISPLPPLSVIFATHTLNADICNRSIKRTNIMPDLCFSLAFARTHQKWFVYAVSDNIVCFSTYKKAWQHSWLPLTFSFSRSINSLVGYLKLLLSVYDGPFFLEPLDIRFGLFSLFFLAACAALLIHISRRLCRIQYSQWLEWTLRWGSSLAVIISSSSLLTSPKYRPLPFPALLKSLRLLMRCPYKQHLLIPRSDAHP